MGGGEGRGTTAENSCARWHVLPLWNRTHLSPAFADSKLSSWIEQKHMNSNDRTTTIERPIERCREGCLSRPAREDFLCRHVPLSAGELHHHTHSCRGIAFRRGRNSRTSRPPPLARPGLRARVPRAGEGGKKHTVWNASRKYRDLYSRILPHAGNDVGNRLAMVTSKAMDGLCPPNRADD